MKDSSLGSWLSPVPRATEPPKRPPPGCAARLRVAGEAEASLRRKLFLQVKGQRRRGKGCRANRAARLLSSRAPRQALGPAPRPRPLSGPRRFRHRPRSQPSPSSPPRHCPTGPSMGRSPQASGGSVACPLVAGIEEHPRPLPGVQRRCYFPHLALLTGASRPSYVLQRA